jgi:hypothetical protein
LQPKKVIQKVILWGQPKNRLDTIFDKRCYLSPVEEATCHWEASDALRLSGEKRANRVPQAKAISVETTAYALLQTVAEEDVTYATRIARWLTEQRQYGGGFRSTQVGTVGQATSRQMGRYCRTSHQ